MANAETPDMKLNLDSELEAAFAELLQQRGYESINDFIRDEVRAHRSAVKLDKIKDIRSRMFPNGIQKRGDDDVRTDR